MKNLPWWWRLVPLWADRVLGLTRSIVGSRAVCSRGIVGTITGRKKLPWGKAWVGVTDSGAAWSSRNPALMDAKN